ncbi:MAG: flagellar motor switch protein FliN [Myxococcales bacterium]|nr:flagellar motor switch protein FliN [Myxococcales bacterium]
MSEERKTDAGTDTGSFGFVMDVPLRVTVEIGAAQMLLQEVLQLDKGSVIELDRGADEPADVLVNGRLVARGEVAIVDDRLGIRIVELLDNAAARKA